MKRVCSPMNLLLAALLLAVNVALNVPLFRPGEMPYRDSIEGGYASMTRFFFDHPNPWGWNPLQYCGLPTQFIYLPGLQYISALLAHAIPIEPTYLYRLLAAALTCLGPSTAFLALVSFTKARWWAFGAMAAYTLYSPLYGLIPTIDRDRAIAQLPWRLLVLVKYGEGPHNAGLALLPVALTALWTTATSRAFWKLLAASVLCAAIALTNWVAALALAFCVLTLVLAAFRLPEFRLWRVVLCGLLAYGLAAFWLTPTFIHTIAFNWPADAFNYHLEKQQTLLLWGLAAGLIAIRIAFTLLFPKETLTCFVALNAFGFGWIVLWFYGRGLNTIPESRRYAIEFELFLVILLFEYFRLVLRRPRPVAWFCALVPAVCLLGAGWGEVRRYVTQGFAARNPVPAGQTIEYRLARKLAELKPAGRVLASGGLRFRLNSWYPIAQVGGGFESGLRNRTAVTLAYQVRTGLNSAAGRETADAILGLRTMGVEYVVVHGANSKEHYRDYKNPAKFDGALELVHREEDDSIYRAPFRSYAHLLRRGELLEWPGDSNLPLLGPYVAAMDDLSRPKLSTAWAGASELRIDGPIEPDTVVAVLINYDAGWRAVQDGKRLEMLRDNLGFTLLRALPSASAHIVMTYHGTTEQRAMAALSGVVWLSAIVWLVRSRRDETRVQRAGSVHA